MALTMPTGQDTDLPLLAALTPACALPSGTRPEKTPTALPGAVSSSKSKL